MPIERPSGKSEKKSEKLSRAAKILLALGEENAVRVLRHLDPESTEKLVSEILQIGRIDDTEKEQLLEDFHNQLSESRETLIGGKDEARKLIIRAMGEEKAREFIERLDSAETTVKFKEFEEYPAATIAGVLQEELPQTAAVVLSHLSPKFAASVLSEMDSSFQAQTAGRIARLAKIHPTALEAMYYSLKKKLESMEKEPEDFISGEDKLSAILNYMDQDSEETILSSIRTHEPDMAERIREKMFIFEDLIQLSKTEIRKIFETIPDESIWAKALKGSGKDLSRHILGSVSLNRSSDISEEIKRLSPVRLIEIEENRRIIMRAVEELEASGDILLRKEKEDYIE